MIHNLSNSFSYEGQTANIGPEDRVTCEPVDGNYEGGTIPVTPCRKTVTVVFVCDANRGTILEDIVFVDKAVEVSGCFERITQTVRTAVAVWKQFTAEIANHAAKNLLDSIGLLSSRIEDFEHDRVLFAAMLYFRALCLGPPLTFSELYFLTIDYNRPRSKLGKRFYPSGFG